MDHQNRGTIGLGKVTGSGPADRETIRIRGYQVGEFLGRGGFGDVWKGTRLHPGPTTVAIKVLRNRLAGDRDLERFRRESMILGRLEHPAIATVFDAGTLDDGRPWFAMEFVDGSSLGDVARDGLPIEEALEIMEGVCRGVGHAHAKGIIHCDLKPENILVSHIDGQWRPKVIDFGVATAIEGDEPGRTCLHSTDVTDSIGTRLGVRRRGNQDSDPLARFDLQFDVTYIIGPQGAGAAPGGPAAGLGRWTRAIPGIPGRGNRCGHRFSVRLRRRFRL